MNSLPRWTASQPRPRSERRLRRACLGLVLLLLLQVFLGMVTNLDVTLLLAITSLGTLLIAVRTRQRIEIALATVGAASIIGAGFNGLSFINYGHDLSSLIMTACALLAIASYTSTLYASTTNQPGQLRQRADQDDSGPVLAPDTPR